MLENSRGTDFLITLQTYFKDYSFCTHTKPRYLFEMNTAKKNRDVNYRLFRSWQFKEFYYE
jgi:hypothetical protein